VVYLAAIARGMGPEDLVADGPLTLGRWSPGNGAWRPRGEITAEEALAQSVNTAAVRVLQRAGGPRPVREMAARLGLAGPFPNDATIALGTGEVTVLDLAAAYAAFANGGLRVFPFGIASATAGGQPAPVPRRPPERVVEAEQATTLRRMLEAVVARGSGRAAALPGRVVAGKTGTTQDNRDAWFVGFTGSAGGGVVGGLVLAVWLGNDDATPMDDVRGGTLPAQLFRAILEAANPGERP
jgi:penicillin-binding protein 1A